jgi:hypothetical protein
VLNLGPPGRWWARQSLRARLTLLATALFSMAVVTGAVLVLVLQRYALVRVLDSAAAKTAHDIAQQFANGSHPRIVDPTTSGIEGVQVVNENNSVIAASPGEDFATSVVTEEQLKELRDGNKLDISSTTSDARLRVYGRKVGRR